MSGPWAKYATAGGPWTKYSPPPAQPQGAAKATVTAAGRGLLWGLGDEAKAAVQASIPGVIDAMNTPLFEEGAQPSNPVSRADTWRERYEQNLRDVRASEKADEEAHPLLTAGGEIAGNLMSLGGAAKLGVPVVPASGPSFMGNVAKYAGTGAAYAGAQGFNEGEGGFRNRVANAIPSAGIGGLIGGAFPIAGVAGRKLLETGPGRYVSEKVISPLARVISGAPRQSLSAAAPDGSPGVMGPATDFARRTGNVSETGAVQRLTTAAQRSGMSAQQAAARRAQLGDEAMIADLDPQFLSEARRANTLPGQTRTHAKNVLESRNRQTGNRIVSAFEGSEPPPSAYALRGEGQAFDQNLRAVGERVYNAMDEAGLRQTPELMAIYENPHVAAAIDGVLAAERATRIGTNRPPAAGPEIMHKVKQAIWDLGFDKDTARPGPMASWYRDLGIEYMNRLKRANPRLAEADRAYAEAAALPEFFDAGASFLGREGVTEKAIERSAPALADLLAGANPQQRIAARTGATNAARSQAQESQRLARALAQRIDESAPVQARISELYSPERASEIVRRAGAEKQFAETSNEILRGSKTADKLAEAIDTNAQLRMTPGSVLPRFIQNLGEIPEMLLKPNEAVRDAIGRATLNPNSEETQRLLRLIYQELERRGRGSPLAASIAGSTGSFSGP